MARMLSMRLYSDRQQPDSFGYEAVSEAKSPGILAFITQSVLAVPKDTAPKRESCDVLANASANLT